MSNKLMRTVTVIHAGKVPDTVITEQNPDLRRLQDLVGGYVEVIPRFKQFNGKPTIWVYRNERAELLDLPMNARATDAWRRCDIRTTDHLRGTIVVIQECEA